MGDISVCVLGSLNKDITVYTPRFPVKSETLKGLSYAETFGGKGANQAVMCGKLTSGSLKVEMIGCLGCDSTGEETLKNLR